MAPISFVAVVGFLVRLSNILLIMVLTTQALLLDLEVWAEGFLEQPSHKTTCCMESLLKLDVIIIRCCFIPCVNFSFMVSDNHVNNNNNIPI